MTVTAEDWIHRLGLKPHPEGGFFKETYRDPDLIPTGRGLRPAGTHIYFLLRQGECSHLHRIQSAEGWHFYAGVPLVIHQFSEGYVSTVIGDLNSPSPFQMVVPKGVWFGAEVMTEGYSLVGCTVSPGFDFLDFELAEAQSLTLQYPEHKALIQRLCLR